MVSCALPQPAGLVQNNPCVRAATVKSGVRKPQAGVRADQSLLLIKVKPDQLRSGAGPWS